MSNPYMTREGGATVTVFVPYDCRNNCPFCVNKEEYSDTTGFSLEKICESIKVMDEITPYCDFVFTGGEPFSSLDSLQKLLDCVPNTHKVYINTTFPVFDDQPGEEMIKFCEKNKDKITCINISRHLVKYVEESPDELLGRIPVNTRVNCVLYKDYPTERLMNYVERFKKYDIPIQFRFDYTDTTPENLYEEENDKILHDLKDLFKYTGLDGCRMRCGYHFDYENLEMTYHKTLPYSTIVETQGDVTYDILYDILIKQNGDIHGDWDGKILDVDKYRNVTFEPYDLKWLEVCE
jgi:organic radical activating enzyme